MMRALRRLLLLALLAGVAAAVWNRLHGPAECGPQCDCSQGMPACSCGHSTCLAPASA